MRGRQEPQVTLLAFVDLEERVPADHPLRAIKALADEALERLSPEFDRMYADVGRPSIPPERLLKASLLIGLFSVRSERAFCEELDYNLLFRWFLGMHLMERSFDATGFTKNRQRLLEHRVGQQLFDEVVLAADRRSLLSDEHFTVDGTLIEAAASLKSFKPRAGVLLLAEEGVDHGTGGIVHGDQQRERRRLVPQPGVMTAAHLDQHALPRHALTANPVLGRTPSPRTAQPRVDQDAPQGGPADVDAVALTQQLAEMGVVGPGVPGTSQTHYIGHHGIGCCVGWPAAPVAVSNGGGSLIPVSR